MRIVAEFIYEFFGDLRDVFTVRKHLFVVEAYNVALGQREPVHLGTSYRVSNLTRRDVIYCVQHIYEVFVCRDFGIERKRGGDTLRNTLRRYDVDLLALYQRFRLFRRQYDVFVVREYENVFGVDLYNRVGNILRGGVHSLTALDNLIAVEVFEYIRKTCTRADRQHAHFFLFRLVLLDEFAVFFEHVFDFDSVDFAELQRLAERLVGVIGMNVDLDEFEISYDEYAVAYRHKIFFKPVYIGKRRFLL